VKLNARQLGEFERREFLGDETWRRWKTEYDQCMAFRKTIKGKPTDEQLVLIKANAEFIEFYGSVLFHSVMLAKNDLCACTRCGQKRTPKLHVTE
jgi:hypothetical protein